MTTNSLTIIEAIAREEGYGISGDIPTRDNNPGDIEAGSFATHEGSDGVDASKPRFARFPDSATGFQALRDLLNSSSYLGLTIHDALNRYAPPVGNDTSSYESNICEWTGLAPLTVLTSENIG